MPRYHFQFHEVVRWLPYLVSGIPITLLISALAMSIGVLVGMAAAISRLSRWRPLSFAATAYTEFFRTTPQYTQLIWIYYSLPLITGLSLTPFVTAVIALGLNTGAFMAEIFRAGILSIPRGQLEAGLSVGMRPWQAFRRITLPQALLRVSPPAITMWISLFKDSATVSVIAVADLTYRARIGAFRTFRPLEFYTIVAVLYLMLAIPQSRAADWVHDRLRVQE
jgi:polar amino acid transport system permease protein